MKYFKKNSLIFPFILICLASIPLLDIYHPGLPVTHDGRDHVARIANFYQNLEEGNLIPRWAGNLDWGYGHPILMFLYPLPSYFASLFHFFGFSFVDSTKLVFAIGYILSGLTMYLWLKEFLPKYGAFVGGLFYIFAPYRFVDLYVRGAIGEHVAFIFPPLVLYFLLKLSKSKEYFPWWMILGSFSLAGLILSHNAISLMFLPIILLYIIYLIWNSKKKKSLILNSCFLILFGFTLSAFFWLPAFMEGKYTLRDIVTSGSIEKNFANFSQFIYGAWSYGISGQFTLQAGILHWLAVITGIPACFYLFKKRNKIWILTLGVLIIFGVSLFLIEKNSQFIWEKITIIQKFQFPWRFLSLTVFASSVLGAIVVSFSPKKYITSLVVVITIGILFLNKDYWHARNYLNKPQSFYTSVYHGTTDTGESAPIWSVRFMEKEPSKHLEVIEGKAVIKEIKRTVIDHQYRIKALTNVRIRENTLYFPGWEVLIDGKAASIQFQDPENRGIITFDAKKGSHDVQVKLSETKLRLIADIISGVGLLLLILIGIRNKVIKL